MREDWIKQADQSAKMDAVCFISDINNNADDLMVEREWYVERVLYHFHRALKEDTKQYDFNAGKTLFKKEH